MCYNYLLTPWSKVILENLTVFQLVKKFPAFYGKRRVFHVVSFPQVSPPKPCIRLCFPIRATFPAHFILLYLITQTILGLEYRSLSSSLCSFLHSPVISSLLGPNILLNTPILQQPQPTFLPQCERPRFTPIQNNRKNYSSV